MPRSKRPVVSLCLSIASTALALAIPRRMVNEALDEGKLELRKIGQMYRVPVSSIIQWMETWPLTTRKTKGVPHGRD
jgi:hypothetical protein